MEENQIKELAGRIASARSIVIGGGSGLSASAGLTYSGERFERHFADFIAKFHISDMYQGGFYPYESPEEYWAWWSRHIYWNRCVKAPKRAYEDLLELVRDKDYFVLTTNVDHQFQKAGFDKDRLFYTQGDYGLWQCSVPCHMKTYDNQEVVRQMVKRQERMRVPGDLIPHCPICKSPMGMNLRIDSTFVEDEGWHKAAKRYSAFLSRHEGQDVVYLELGVGNNTPGIIKYPFWKLVSQNPKSLYACINEGQALIPPGIASRSIYIDHDIGRVLTMILEVNV